MESNKSQQLDEIELLQNICIDNMKIIETEPFHKFEIEVVPDADDEPLLCILFEVEFIEQYPSEKIFKYKISDKKNKAVDSQFAELLVKIDSMFEENKGFPVVYQIVELIKEYINELDLKLKEQANVYKKEEQIKNDKLTNKIVDVKGTNLLLETKKFIPVTKESYKEWFDKFIKEKAKEGGKKYQQRKEIMSRQSGREFFMNKDKMKDKDAEDIDDEEGEIDDDDEEYVPDKIDEDLFDEDIDFEDIDFDEG